MSARTERENSIRYLSVDEMTLKIAEMRAARAVPKMRIAHSPLIPKESPHTPKESVQAPPELEFPDYVSHCEGWSAATTGVQTDKTVETARVKPLHSSSVVSRVSAPGVPLVAHHSLQTSSPTKVLFRQYICAAATAGIAALLLAAGVRQLHIGTPAMHTMASANRNLVAGGDSWNEVSTDDIISQAVVPEEAPRQVRRKIAPDQLEGKVRAVLARNGFPDIGVSASHLGDVYLAGAVFSMQEATNIVKIARLAARGGSVFFLHPEIHEPQGPTFFGATAEYAPEVWGARVRNVVIGSPADKAGIRRGDLIREFDHATIADAQELEKAVADHGPGARVTVRSWRNGENKYSIARLTGLSQYASR